ncbi:MAG: DUF3367 domain-containing protein [Actinomycetota bacterium]|nr:DUF3367 domain-containing protein [Actinomycetota bacterium]
MEIERASRWRLPASPWLLAGVLAFGVAVAVATNSPGWYVGDNRFEQFWSPGRVLARTPFLWDASRGLGRPRGEFVAGPTAVLALLRGLGASPAVAERLWHAGLLLAAGLGAALLLRRFRPAMGPAHLIAALFYAFNPYSAVFLLPTGLFLNYVLAPWMLLAFVRGVQDRPWRWAAIFALLVWSSGSVDPPGLFYALVLLAPVALYLWLVEGVGWSRIAGWLARAALLSLLVSAAMLVQVWYGVAALSARLLSTESVQAVQSTTSWAESWRGLGFWVSYFSEGGQLLRQDHAAYFFSAPVILATFVPPAVALAALGWSRWRPRLLMASLALTSLTLMVASYPPGRPSPLGRLLLEAYERMPALTALRTSYKAGAGLLIGVSCLFGIGIVTACTRLRQPSQRATAWATALLVLGVASFPFWTGQLYPADNRMRSVPGYWESAIAWLERQPGDSRVLILPGTSVSRYRWGSPGDDIFDALLGRPHIAYTSFPLSTARGFDLIRAIDERVQSGSYRPGTLAPVARRLGIEYVLIRNDLDWQTLQRPRPATLQALRHDPDLRPVVAFGDPGENVVASEDTSAAADTEARLPPVEIFQVRQPSEPIRAVDAEPPLLVSGGGDAWLQLAARGLLDAAQPLQYTADASDRALSRFLAAGAGLAVTDTNARRVSMATRFGEMNSHILTSDEDLDRPARDLFQRTGSQTVAAFDDAEAITSDSSSFQPSFRPAAAFDGDEQTWWLTGAPYDPIGSSIEVRFAGPVTISSVEVVAAPASGRVVSGATILLDDRSIAVEFEDGRARVAIPPQRTSALAVRVDAMAGPGPGDVGFAEIRVPPLDLVERLRTPDDIFRAAERDPALRDRLQAAPVTYLFERVRGKGLSDVERRMRRSFRVLGDRPYQLDGTLTVGPSTPDRLVDAVIGAAVGGPACSDEIVAVDGTPAPVRVEGSVDDLLAGRPVPYRGCLPVRLDSGWHRLDAGPDLVVETASLTTGRAPGGEELAGTRVQVLGRDPSGMRLRIHAPPGGAFLLTGRSYDRNWGASVNGVPFGPPRPLDAQAAWVVPAGDHAVDVSYRPQRLYDLALVLTLSSVAVCLWLAIRRRGST